MFPRSLALRCGTLALGLITLLLEPGCLTVGQGLTTRQWQQAWADLHADLTPAEVRARLGEPRNIDPPGQDDTDSDEVWLYTLPEVTGTHLVHEGEKDIRLPNGRIAAVPHEVERDIRVIAEYRLYWHAQKLVRWERTESD